MSPKIALAFLLAASAALAKGQNAPDSIRDSYHIFFPAMGKDILAAHIGAHSYKIVNLCDKPSEYYVDDKKIAAGELSKYDATFQRIRSSVRDDDEERQVRDMERDRRQAERDERQAQRDREQSNRDREQHQRERAEQQIERAEQQREQQRQHAEQQRERAEQQHERAEQQRDRQRERAEQQREQVDLDIQAQERNREQEALNHIQEQRNREQAERDIEAQARNREAEARNREQEQRQHVQISFDNDREYRASADGDCNCGPESGWTDADVTKIREQSAEDRAMLKKGIQALVDEHIIDNTQHLKTLVLTDTDLSINGVKQPPAVYQQVRSKLGDWAHNGFTYDSPGADNFSLSIND